MLYGHSISKDLLHLNLSSSDKSNQNNHVDEEEDKDDPESWSAEAHFSNTNYQGKKMVFLLFINRMHPMFSLSSFPDLGFIVYRQIGRICPDEKGVRSSL